MRGVDQNGNDEEGVAPPPLLVGMISGEFLMD